MKHPDTSSSSEAQPLPLWGSLLPACTTRAWWQRNFGRARSALPASGVDAPWLATAITIFTIAILCLALVLSRFDAAKNILLGSVARLDGQLLRLAALDPLTDLPNQNP